MKNISFDNPLYLLLLAPLLLLVIIPYAVAIKKTNSDKNTRASLWLHVFVAVLVSLAVGGATLTTVITKTVTSPTSAFAAQTQNTGSSPRSNGHAGRIAAYFPAGRARSAPAPNFRVPDDPHLSRQENR